MCDEVCARLIREIQRGQRRLRKQQEKDIKAFEAGRYKRKEAARKRKSKERAERGSRV